MNITTKQTLPVKDLKIVTTLTVALIAGASQSVYAMDVHINNTPVRDSSYSDEYKKDDGKSWTITPSDNSCHGYKFVIDDGSGAAPHEVTGNHCSLHRKSGASQENYHVSITCLKQNGDPQDNVPVSDVTVDLTKQSEGNGRAIFDFTAHTDTHSIASNMSFTNSVSDSSAPECEYQRGQTATGNCIEGAKTEVLVNENENLNLYKGEQDQTRRENLGDNSDTRLTYFNKNKPWFDVDRLRLAADWLKIHKPVTVTLPDETKGGAATVANPITGTMTMRQFLRNVAADQTMYGIVRVLVGFEKDAQGNIHHCSPDNDDGVCDCATDDLDEDHVQAEDPTGTYHAKICGMIKHRFEEIEMETEDHDSDMQTDTLCSLPISATSKIKVKGALFFDYVYEDNDGTIHPVNLDVNDGIDDDIEEISIGMPILVNWDDGMTQHNDPVVDSTGMLNPNLAAAIEAVSADNTADASQITFDNVPQSALDAYNYYQLAKNPSFTTITTRGEFEALPVTSQYHMLMPSGYAKGWADAFNRLQLTTSQWENIMADSGSDLPEFKAPDNGASTTWTPDQFRSEVFEDIPAFLYAGGFINIKTNKIFISGLTYIPQMMTLDVGGDEHNTGVATTAYFSGAVMVRDGFFIQARQDGLLLMSSDPNAYSKVLTNGGRAPSLSVSHSPGVYATNNLGNSGGQAAGYGGLGAQKQVSPPLWVEIRPQ